MSYDTAWSTNYFTYEAFGPGDIENVPLLDIVRGNIVLIELDSSNNIINNPTPFFILTTAKINNEKNTLGNVPATAYQQFMIVQGDSNNYGKTSGSLPNGQDPLNFYFSPFVSQVTQDIIPLYGYLSPGQGITFIRADIFTDSYSNYIHNIPDYKPNINSLPNPVGKNINEWVYLTTCQIVTGIYGPAYAPTVYSNFKTISEIIEYQDYKTWIQFNEIKTNSSLTVGIKYTINTIVYDDEIDGKFTNFLTSLGGTLLGGKTNKTNISMGFQNSNVFYQNDPDNYIGSFYISNNVNNWSIGSLIINAGTTTKAGLIYNMVFQFIPLTYLINPGPGRVPLAPSYLNLTYPPFGPPQSYPTLLPNVNAVNYVAPANVQGAITNWYSNTTSVACSTKVISNSFCGFTPQYYYNSLQGEFYKVEDNPVCGATFDPPDSITGYSSSCDNFYSPGSKSACVPNFVYDIDPTQPPFICGPSGAKFDSADYYAMEYNNFINYFYILPSTGIPYSLTSFTPRPYIDTSKISQNSEGTPKTTFWNSSLFILLAVIFFVLILGFIVFFIYKQNTKKNPFPNYLNKYYS